MHQPFLNRIRHLIIGLLVGAGFFGALSYAVFTEPTLPPPDGNVSLSFGGGAGSLQTVTDIGNITDKFIDIAGFKFPAAAVIFNTTKDLNYDEDEYINRDSVWKSYYNVPASAWYSSSLYNCDNDDNAIYTCPASATKWCKDIGSTMRNSSDGFYLEYTFTEVKCTNLKLPAAIFSPATPQNIYRVFSWSDTVANNTEWEVWGNGNVRLISGEPGPDGYTFENGGIPTAPSQGSFVLFQSGEGCFTQFAPSSANNWRFKVNALCTNAGNQGGNGELWFNPN